MAAIADLPPGVSYGDKYGPAMRIYVQAEADAYFEACVRHSMLAGGLARAEAEELERANLGYWAGYHGKEARLRVRRLFGATHPVFGERYDLTDEELVRMGMDWAKAGGGH